MSKAIFLGTFDPPHYGHHNCIKSVIDSGIMDKYGIDKIHIIPTLQNPNKQQSTKFIHRYKMCEFMFNDLIDSHKVVIDDVECDVEHTYTYELFDYFHSNKDEYIKDDFWWIITVETLEEIVKDQWVNSKQLLKNNKFLIVTSNKYDNNYIKELTKQCKYFDTISLKYNFEYHSSDIKKIYKNGAGQILDYINPAVQEYIIDNNLYLE